MRLSPFFWHKKIVSLIVAIWQLIRCVSGMITSFRRRASRTCSDEVCNNRGENLHNILTQGHQTISHNVAIIKMQPDVNNKVARTRNPPLPFHPEDHQIHRQEPPAGDLSTTRILQTSTQSHRFPLSLQSGLPNGAKVLLLQETGLLDAPTDGWIRKPRPMPKLAIWTSKIHKRTAQWCNIL